MAPLGTALTEQQLERLWRIVDVPMLCLDGDAAGQKAAVRAAHRALPLLAPGRSLAFVTLPEGQDPDDLVRARGVAAFEKLVADAEPLANRLWSHDLAAEPTTTPEQRAGLRQRLTDRAQTIADLSVRHEYQGEFRHRFDQHFSRQPARQAARPAFRQDRRTGRWMPPPAPVTDDAKAFRAGGIDRVLAKAVLAGLIRHPAEIARHMEMFGSLRLADGALARSFEAVMEVALEDQVVDSDRLVTILTTSGLGEIASDLLRADTTPYTFTQAGADAGRACADLDEAIAIMVAQPEVDHALAGATSAMQERFTDEAFARQVALVKEKHALELRLANLVQSNEDARALRAED